MKQILDHGYVTLIEHWGSDERVIEAARMSTQKGFQGWGGKCTECNGRGWHVGECHPQEPCGACRDGVTVGDEKLLRYLYTNRHSTPFEMGGLVIEVQAPIFVFREWHRHRTQSYNEMSARYAPLPNLNYVPTLDRCMLGGGNVTKQAGAVVDTVLTEDAARDWLDKLAAFYDGAEQLYQEGLASGLPKELARLVLPVGRYSRMRASANLRNWLAFLTLRVHKTAQWEIRQYANAVGELVAAKFPRTWALFAEELP